MKNNFKLIAASPVDTRAEGTKTLQLSNDIHPAAVSLNGVNCIELHFPTFTDGRAYSQAFLLRRRLGFAGDLRATGDVLVDQLQPLQRCGFSSAVLRADQDLTTAQRQLDRFDGFYQGDALQRQPPFATSILTSDTFASAPLGANLPVRATLGAD